MGQGDPVSLVRGATGTPKPQKVWNRTKKEAHTIQADHCREGLTNADVTVELICPGPNWHVRFTELHFMYTDGQGIAGQLEIRDGVTTYRLNVYDSNIHRLRFDTTRWARGNNVVIELDNAGAGIAGMINVLGAFAERIENPAVTV
jgi:hypothetical protein